MKICVVGLGYIGLPSACLFASKGYEVYGLEVRADVVEQVNSGRAHIVEPDLDVILSQVTSSGVFRAGTQPKPADIFVIAVPTPFRENYAPDVSIVESAVKSICPVIKAGDLILLESTSPVGTTEGIRDVVKQMRPELVNNIHFAYCPERVLPGKILKELVENDRVVGGITESASAKARDFYKSVIKGEVFVTNARTAELVKLTENSFRDVNIAFANELSMICDKYGIDVFELIRHANRHPRVNILQPGPGVGGHCIAVDPWFIVHDAPEESKLIRTAREVNLHKTKFVIDKVVTTMNKHKETSVACLGMSFKADIDDLRESPAIEVVHALAQHKGFKIIAVEPHIDTLPQDLKILPNIHLAPLSQALESCSVIVLLVDHKAFKSIDHKILSEKIVIDTRGAFGN